ncbi:hypothetical protein F3Y22_tig00110283pilonHSYRG00093 [Hibiscus syriacus]|uniref:SHSP domain-containing protein n=1 Tax=Hibiscus syriacus TaxID=106335 RepID=A0A6A3B4C2_HIBSY|nr:uncharacterized protein LOC120116096 [Hibiscus syriacus]KAE8711616.1 hypothetical protein F3Y22_tig00110283pilonHSYRG00093 [Hibiscus syriacus]
MSLSYQQCEPEFQYHKGEDHDIVEFHVKDFRKDQLRVHMSRNGVLTVSGERPHDGTKRIRFHKEFNPPNDCKPDQIRAKLSSGVLFITIPKKRLSPQSPGQDPQTQVHRTSNGNVALPKIETKSFISRLKIKRKAAMKVVAGVAMLSLMFIVVFYVYKVYAPVIMHI